MRQILHLTLIGCLILAMYRLFGVKSQLWSQAVMQAANLGLLTTASLGAYYSSAKWRRLWLGYALFGWAYLLVGLRVFESEEDMINLGWMAGIICALAAMLLPSKRN